MTNNDIIIVLKDFGNINTLSIKGNIIDVIFDNDVRVVVNTDNELDIDVRSSCRLLPSKNEKIISKIIRAFETYTNSKKISGYFYNGFNYRFTIQNSKSNN